MLHRTLFICLLVALAGLARRAPAADDAFATADARIEKHRKSDVTITVNDVAGKPVAGAKVEVRQLRHRFLFGCNIYRWGRHKEPQLEEAYRGQFEELLNYATIAFYWWSYETQRGQPGHAYAKEVAEWCRERTIATKGHPLMWNFGDPKWLTDEDDIRKLQLERIDDCVSRFKRLIERWDVVNEATHFERPEATAKAPKVTAMWQKAGRVELTRECFARARQASPKAELLINDYRADPAYAKLIEQLIDDDGRPVYDVIGIQSHMHQGVWSNARLWEVCERFAKFGVPLHFTELTILSGEKGWMKPKDAAWPSTPEGEAQQAREVVRIYTMLFSHPAVEAITWWDFSDNGAWQHAPAGLLRQDMTPKPAYAELKKLIKDKWRTNASLTTGGDGTAALRGFHGDYEVKATVGDKAARAAFALCPDKYTGWAIQVR